MLDGPQHTAIRRLIAGALSARPTTRSSRPRSSVCSTELVPIGELDLRARFAFMLPTDVIADLMDLPDDANDGLEDLLRDVDLPNPPSSRARGRHTGAAQRSHVLG
jgi:cytochrome P450